MKFSVIIPAYNAAKTIAATLDSVLAQTVVPFEILVFDDGSTDNMAVILASYKPRVTVFSQSNQGAAHARNFLCAQAQGDILAFLDADDLWHPCYLKAQKQMIEKHPDAVAHFTEHENIVGLGDFKWPKGADCQPINPELIQPAVFIKRYNETPLSFQMSCMCVRKSVPSQLGPEPFRVTVADDTFFHTSLPLLGPVAHTTARLVAYRINESSLSSNRLRMSVLVVDDYNTMIRIIRNLLKQLGFENIDDASDGSAALNKMRGKKYGLVISDWNMEPMTGYDLLREVRADPNLATTPFIMITAESKTENVIAAKKAGVNNYIVKPFNAQTLKTKIEAVFAEGE